MGLFHKRTSEEIGNMLDWPVVLPIGSIEQHGPHLPLETDSLLVSEIAGEVGRISEVLVLPTLTYGVSPEHMAFPGTVTLKPETLKETIKDIAASLLASGFKKLHIMNYHGGNKKHVLEAMPKIEALGLSVRYHRVLGRLGKFDHAGELETSLMLFLFPDLVRKNEIKEFEYTVPEGDGWKTEDYSASGVIGDAASASAKKGKLFFARIVKEIVEEIEDERKGK